MNNLLATLARLKVYFSSASLYLSVINFLLVLATFKQTYSIELSVWSEYKK